MGGEFDTSGPAVSVGRCRGRRWFLAVVVALALWLVVSWVVAYRLTHRRRPPFAEPLPAASSTTYESLRLTTRDGLGLGAWYVPGRDDAPAVLVLHGNGGSRWNCLGRAGMLTSAGYPVLMISLRAHGDSAGDYNDIGYGARHDVVAAVAYLERRRPGKPIVILGTSMGGAAAVFAAGELGHRVRGYILESPYRDLRTAVWNRLDDTLPPVLDRVAYAGLLAVSPLVIPHIDRISPWTAIGGVPGDTPVLILAGENDRRARPEEATALYERVRDHGRIVIFQGADHLRMIEADPERYRREILAFLAQIVGKAGLQAQSSLKPGTPGPAP